MTKTSTWKIRSEETWYDIRREWERGETGASLALRYQVGLSNLWRRRAAEGWRRLQAYEQDPEPEPVEGWVRYAARRKIEFEERLGDARDLAECLVEAMKDERLMRAPHWHIPWLYHWRAEHLGEEAAARDRARAVEAGYPWAESFWREDGSLMPLGWMDQEMARLHPKELREALGAPEGVEV
ncbi:hypothetical protein [Brevundimonas sp.]|jgi:hypothetical protein|uniref:hypothetical protein n=1 Tax=Brevundimonas sp. TaxID=1871086 RepID=UPI0037BF9FB2